MNKDIPASEISLSICDECLYYRARLSINCIAIILGRYASFVMALLMIAEISTECEYGGQSAGQASITAAARPRLTEEGLRCGRGATRA